MASAEQPVAFHAQLKALTAQFEAVKEKLDNYDLQFHEQTPWKAKVEAMLLEQKTQQYATI